MNLSWTKFKEKHLFSINLGIMASLLLWQLRKDLTFHGIIAAWVIAGFFLAPLRVFEKKAMITIGKINGTILLTIFYFVFFTPFSFLYRWFFRHESFRKGRSTFIAKTDACDFTRPF